MTTANLGKSGEELACRELERLGYEILARRYRRRVGEVDIVARDGRILVFVEVKTRRGRAYGDGAEAVTPLKQRRLSKVALEYVQRHRLETWGCRFDVVTIDVAGGTPVITVHRNAFEAVGL